MRLKEKIDNKIRKDAILNNFLKELKTNAKILKSVHRINKMGILSFDTEHCNVKLKKNDMLIRVSMTNIGDMKIIHIIRPILEFHISKTGDITQVNSHLNDDKFIEAIKELVNELL